MLKKSLFDVFVLFYLTIFLSFIYTLVVCDKDSFSYRIHKLLYLEFIVRYVLRLSDCSLFQYKLLEVTRIFIIACLLCLYQLVCIVDTCVVISVIAVPVSLIYSMTCMLFYNKLICY